MKTQKGFTLIELVMVIVILGVLAATALPKFVDLRSDANSAAAVGVAGGLSSASSINYAGCAVTNNVAGAKCTPLLASAATSTCSSIGALLIPAVTVSVTEAVPATTTQGTVYMTTANNLALTQAGVRCRFTYGNGTAGVNADTSSVANSLSFVGYATGA